TSPGAVLDQSCVTFSTSHRRTVRSLLPESSFLPSREKTREVTSPVCPVSTAVCFPVAASRRMIRPSQKLQAIVLPSRDRVNLLPAPGSSRVSFPVATSQKRTVPAWLTLTRRLSSGVKASPEVTTACLSRDVPRRAKAPAG